MGRADDLCVGGGGGAWVERTTYRVTWVARTHK